MAKTLEGRRLEWALGEGLRRGGKPRRSPVARGLRKEKQRYLEAVRSSPPVALGERLEFPNIFVPENERTFVHLAQAV
jgi:hypothetical protein